MLLAVFINKTGDVSDSTVSRNNQQDTKMRCSECVLTNIKLTIKDAEIYALSMHSNIFWTK